MVASKTSRDGLEPIESASQDELRALQLARLKWSLQHAYDNVPYFRDECELQQVSPADVATLEDLAKFPFMTKEDCHPHNALEASCRKRTRQRSTPWI